MTDPRSRLGSALAARYTIERELGQGGMATVYLAHDVRHDRQVAIKVLHPDLAAALGSDRFLSEIKTTARLQHPHILPLLDSGSAEGLLYYVMPFVAGETLRERLERERQLPVGDALLIAREVADALGEAHARGIVHRDIKPENILLQGGHALVADFGIALAVQQAGGARLTQTGLSLGTPQYMAPEQAMAEKSVDHRADIYALGVVTYEMLAGEPPFTGPTIQAIVAKVVSDAPRPLVQLRRSVPAHVDAAVLHALEKLPADRFRSAGEFAAAISGPPAASHGPAIPARGWRQLAVGSAVAIALFALGWSLGRRREPAVGTSAPPIMFTVDADVAPIAPGRTIAVAPDGGAFVFVREPAGGAATQLALRRFDRAEAVPLEGTDNANNPFFSPDGQWVAFAQQNRLRKLSLVNGVASTITDIPPGFTLHGVWGRDGTILYTVSGRAYRVSADGGAATRVPLPDGHAYASPVLLPGGKQAVFTRSRSIIGGRDREVVVHRLDTGEQRAVLMKGASVEFVPGGYLICATGEGGALVAVPFDADGARLTGQPETLASGISYLARSLPLGVARNGTIVYATEQWSDKELIVVSADSRSTTLLPLGTRAFRGPRFSPDSRRIAVDVEPGGDLMGDIHVYDRESDTFARVTFEGSSIFPEWTADGKAILYSSATRTGERVIHRVPLDRSSAPAVVIKGAPDIFEVAMTTRGDTMLYRMNSDSSGRDIYLRRSDGTSVPFVVAPFNQRSPTISPDGRLVLYVSDESGRSEVYVRPLAAPGSVPVSVAGGAEPRWGSGGREAYYWSNDTLFAVGVTMSPTPNVGARRVAHVGRYEREPFHANYDVAPDGKSFVFIRRARSDARSTVRVLLNWVPLRKPNQTP